MMIRIPKNYINNQRITDRELLILAIACDKNKEGVFDLNELRKIQRLKEKTSPQKDRLIRDIESLGRQGLINYIIIGDKVDLKPVENVEVEKIEVPLSLLINPNIEPCHKRVLMSLFTVPVKTKEAFALALGKSRRTIDDSFKLMKKKDLIVDNAYMIIKKASKENKLNSSIHFQEILK